MEIQIKQEIATAKINMKGFRAQLKSTLNLKLSVLNNFEVIKTTTFTDDQLAEYAYCGIDWGTLISIMDVTKKDVMNIKYLRIIYKDKPELQPLAATKDSKNLVFEQKLRNGEDVLMITDYTTKTDFDIKGYLNFTTYNYGKKKWKVIVDGKD